MSNAALPINKAPNQGAMERRDPVPAGRYWVYIDESEVARWQEWVRASNGKVKPIVTEAQNKISSWVPAVFATRWDLSIITSIAGYWILFDVLEPVKWVGFGYPTTVIDPSVRSATDVTSAPPPAPEWNPLGELFGDLKWLILVAGGLYIASEARSLAQTFGSRRKGAA
jgi:hypothetical protein